MTPGPSWWELLRALWPVFTLVAAIGLGAIMLALRTSFTTTEQHQKHHVRICDVETFVVEQKTALGILPSRQQLGDQIARQSERIAETREELSEGIAELGERVSGMEAGLIGIQRQLETSNTYLHTLLERGLSR